MPLDLENDYEYQRKVRQKASEKEFPGFDFNDRYLWKIIYGLGIRENLSVEAALGKFSSQQMLIKPERENWRNSTASEREQAKRLLEKYKWWLNSDNQAFGMFGEDFYWHLKQFLANP